MKPLSFLLGSGLLLSAVIVAGCPAGPPERKATPDVSLSKSPADLAFEYRRQAAMFRNMAARLELEAGWHAKQGGQDSEQAKRSREMAKEMRSAADEADQMAREYRSQLPHNQVY
ncbi:MAG: hypothetical protein AB1411_06720 [Nitrospirota bacterium]